jgi:hypothetical protein
MRTLPDIIRAALLHDLATPNTEAIILGGSYARGDATPYSDVDIVHFVTAPPPSADRRYVYKDNLLISIATRTFAWYRTAVAQPERAIFVVPALREARVLVDPHRHFQALQQQLETFSWAPLQEAANSYASRVMLNGAESVHKVLSAWARNDATASFTEATALYFDLTRAVAVQGGRLIDGTRTYTEHVQDAVGRDTAWTGVHQQFVALETQPLAAPLVQLRGKVALQLYIETVAVLWSILSADDRRVVDRTVQIIRTALPPAPVA